MVRPKFRGCSKFPASTLAELSVVSSQSERYFQERDYVSKYFFL